MAIKIYRKRGKLDYKEKRMVSQIQEALTKKFKDNPELERTFNPANTKEQLQQLHNIYCAEEVQFEEIKPTPQEKTPQPNPSENMAQEPKVEPTTTAAETETNNEPFVDPFNREEPVVRDYVMDDGMKKIDAGAAGQNTQPPNSFSEPVTFDESFRLPEDEPATPNQQKAGQPSAPKKPKVQSITPEQTGSEDSRKKNRRKRFARNIIQAVCNLLERGFIWYGTKNINDAKLAEYEITGELDRDSLQTLVTLNEGQEATVREFFQQHCLQVKKDAIITKEQRADLTDTLHDVLEERNMVPTPMQDFLMAWGDVVAKQGLDVIVSASQTNSILEQLKAMKKNTENVEHEEVKEQPAATPPPAQPTTPEPTVEAPSASEQELSTAMSAQAPEPSAEHEIGATTNTQE